MFSSSLSILQEGYTALYISQRVHLSTFITERLSEVTVVTQTIRLRRRPVSYVMNVHRIMSDIAESAIFIFFLATEFFVWPPFFNL